MQRTAKRPNNFVQHCGFITTNQYNWEKEVYSLVLVQAHSCKKVIKLLYLQHVMEECMWVKGQSCIVLVQVFRHPSIQILSIRTLADWRRDYFLNLFFTDTWLAEHLDAIIPFEFPVIFTYKWHHLLQLNTSVDDPLVLKFDIWSPCVPYIVVYESKYFEYSFNLLIIQFEC